MKKGFALCCFLTFVALQISFAMEFNFSGEMKTGVYWETRQTGDDAPKELMELGNSDGDSGGFDPVRGRTGIPGRFRLNLEFKPISTIGFRVRFEDSTFTGQKVTWAYSYAYGNFLDDQLKISAGKLGDSPWKSGGPELYAAIDESYVNSFAGIRIEYKPAFVPGLNVGFVLNPPSHNIHPEDVSFISFMSETVLGAAYNHDTFAASISWRLDGVDADNYQYEEGHSMVYRLEEKVLKNYVPGLSVWANGFWTSLVNGMDQLKSFQNWLYIAFDEYNINAQLRVGYHLATKQGDVFSKQLLTIKPIFSYSFTSMLSAGVSFVFAKDFGEISQVDYDNFTVEPQIKFTFNSNAYASFVYGFQQLPRVGEMETASYINLRLVYSF
ncbi:MAG: hypothetical protein LBK73_11605 [Treponema sp.]|jgi:hypothetical protein|nr:hypothetical protein [Treponema sp.]